MDLGKTANTKVPTDEILPEVNSFYETKFFRMLTIVLYLGGVSGLGMMLFIYYMFMWDSRMPPLPEIHHKTHHTG